MHQADHPSMMPQRVKCVRKENQGR